MHGSVHGSVDGWCLVWCMGQIMGWFGGVLCGVQKCMCILPGLVRLDLGFFGGLDGDGKEVVGVVSCEMVSYFVFLLGVCLVRVFFN